MKQLFSPQTPDLVSKSNINLKPTIQAGLVVAGVMLVSSIAQATIGTDASAAGWAGVQGKLWSVWQGMTPVIGLVTLGLGAAAMARQYSLTTTGGIIGVGGVITAGPTIIEQVSGTAIF